jgi:hypothetical protein
LILRTDGRVSYLAISSRQQKITAAILLGFALWGGYATTSMVISGRMLEAKRGELDRAQVAYVDLLNEVAHSYDQFQLWNNSKPPCARSCACSSSTCRTSPSTTSS